MSGCADSVIRTNPEPLIVKAVPVFPAPHPFVVKELKEVCPKDKCQRLYEWLGKLMVFEKQLQVYREGMR